jgi:hypothetical protein
MPTSLFPEHDDLKEDGTPDKRVGTGGEYPSARLHIYSFFPYPALCILTNL